MPNKKRQYFKPEWGYDKELKAILNDTQYADYEKIKPKFASQRRPRQRKEN